MIKGLVEFVVISFAGNQFRGEIIPAVREARVSHPVEQSNG